MRAAATAISPPAVSPDALDEVEREAFDDFLGVEGLDETEEEAIFLSQLKAFEGTLRNMEGAELDRRSRRNLLESAILSYQSAVHGVHAKLLEGTEFPSIVTKADDWLLDADPDTTTATDYTVFMKKLETDLRSACPVYFEKVEEERQRAEKEIEMAAAQKAQKPRDDVELTFTTAQALSRAAKNKEEGNALFKDGNIELAEVRYTKALQYLARIREKDCSEEDKGTAAALRLTCNLNVAQCLLKIGSSQAAERAVGSCTDVLTQDGTNLKALYRRGVAHEKLRNYEASRKDFKKGLELKENDPALTKALARVERNLKSEKEKEKKVYANMFKA